MSRKRSKGEQMGYVLTDTVRVESKMLHFCKACGMDQSGALMEQRRDKHRNRKLELSGLGSPWRRHRILETQHVYFIELNREEGLLYTSAGAVSIGEQSAGLKHPRKKNYCLS